MLSNTHNESHSPKPYLRNVIAQSQRITLTTAVFQICYRALTTHHTHPSRISDMLSNTHNESHTKAVSQICYRTLTTNHTHHNRISDVFEHSQRITLTTAVFQICYRTLTTNHIHQSLIFYYRRRMQGGNVLRSSLFWNVTQP